MNCKEVERAMVTWLLDYCRRCKLETLVVGLSGGIDSAVVAKLCEKVREASDKEISVTCVSMPINILVDVLGNDSQFRAEKLASKMDVAFYKYGIGSILLPVHNMGLTKTALGQGNFAARIRTNILYDFAGRHNGIVVGTGNLDEEYIGYCTKGGDGLSDVLPLAEFHKKEVYELGEYWDVDKEILEAAPSAELWEGQTDQKELSELIGVNNVTYDEIGEAIDILRNDVNLCQYPDRLTKIINGVESLHNRNRHKSQPPQSFSRRFWLDFLSN